MVTHLWEAETVEFLAIPMPKSFSAISLFLIYAKYRYIASRVILRIKMGKTRRDEYMKQKGIKILDFLPERAYSINGIKAILRKGTHDYFVFFVPREQDVKPHTVMNENETFVDVGANVGSYSLKIANDYKDKGVKVIAIEAEPETLKALVRNIRCNNLQNIRTINIAASDHEGIVTIYQRSPDGVRVGSALHSIYKDINDGNFLLPNGRSFDVGCDTLDNILSEKVDVMKIDIEGAEVLALKGATNTLKHLRKIIVEIHGDNLDAVRRILESHNFRIETTGINQHMIGSK